RPMPLPSDQGRLPLRRPDGRPAGTARNDRRGRSTPRMSPAKFVAAQKSAPGADAATSLRTEGDQPSTTKEAVVPNHGPAIVDVLTRVDAKSLRRSEEHTSELQSRFDLVCRLLLEKKK